MRYTGSSLAGRAGHATGAAHPKHKGAAVGPAATIGRDRLMTHGTWYRPNAPCACMIGTAHALYVMVHDGTMQ